MFSKKYFTKFLSALLTAALITSIFPLEGFRVYAVEDDDSDEKYVYQINDESDNYEIYVFDSKTHKPVKGATVYFSYFLDPDHPYDNTANFNEPAKTTNDKGYVSYDLEQYLSSHATGDKWLDVEFDLSVSFGGTGYNKNINTKDSPNSESEKWKTYCIVELEPSEYEEYIEYNNNTDITYDGNTHEAEDFYSITNKNLVTDTHDDDDENYEFTFSEEGNHYFSIHFSGTGLYHEEIGDDGKKYYVDEFSKRFDVTITKEARKDFKFATPGPIEIDLSVTDTFVNTASSKLEPTSVPKDIKYSLSKGSNIATVDSSTGEVIFTSEGEATVKAEMEPKGNYGTSFDEYTITAKKRLTASFESSTLTMSFDDEKVPENPLTVYKNTYNTSLTANNNTYKTSYEITDDPNGNVATIVDPSNGEITVKGAGSVRVKVTVTAQYCYSTTAYYTLIINKGVYKLKQYHEDFRFEYGKQYPIFDGDVSGFAYDIDPISAKYVTINTEENYFEIIDVPSHDPSITNILLLPADFSFSVSKTDDTNYEPIRDVVFSGLIFKAKQTATIASGYAAYTKPEDTEAKDYIRVSGTPHGKFDWVNKDDPQDLIETIDYDPDSNRIVICYKTNAACEPHVSVPLVFRFAGDSHYESLTLNTSIVVALNEDIKTQITYTPDTPNGEHGYYTVPVKMNNHPYSDVTFRNPTDLRDPAAHEQTIKINGDYPELRIWLYRGNESNIKIDGPLYLDQNAPEYFSVDIIDPTAKAADKNPVIEFIDTITFGLYTNTVGLFTNNDITVIVRVKDKDSGFGRIEYSYGELTQGQQPTYTKYEDDKLSKSKEIVEYSFTISPEARGNLRVRAYDYAGNCVATHDENGEAAKTGTYFTYDGNKITDINNHQLTDTEELLVVSDRVSPEVTVEFNNNKVFNKSYYDDDRTATITFKEANFYSDDVKIKVTKDGTTIVNPATSKKDVIDKLGGAYDYENKTITVPFKGDGHYTFSIEYIDRSGNMAVYKIGDKEYDTYSTEFVIDKTDPEVEISFNNNTVKNDSYFSSDRTATIKIKEHNYDVSDLKINIKRSLNDETELSTVSAEDYIDTALSSDKDDVHIIVLHFTENADYDFSFTYKDRANRVGKPNYADGTVAKRYFTIDKVDPIVEVSYDNNTVYNGWFFNEDRTATITVTEHNFDENNTIVLVDKNPCKVEWTHSGNVHTAKVDYTENDRHYFGVTCQDLAERSCSNVDYGDSQAPTDFIIDKTPPTELNILVNGKSVLGGNSITFDTFYKDAIEITLSANGDNSGLYSLEYQLVDKTSDYSLTGTWEKYTDAGITISDSQKFILYLKATDYASNVAYANSTGIIVDNKQPEGETHAPDIDIIPSAANANGYYKGDVTVQLNIVDPKYLGDSRDPNGYYSGLNFIKYYIYTTDTEARDEGVLFDLTSNPKIGSSDAKFDGDNLAASWTKTITIDSKKFNSNNVIVEVHATDNAGNERITKTSAGDIKIDVTAPTINVSYDNNEVDSEYYFKADRVATVVITERNFDPKNVVTTITSSNGNTITVDGWAKAPGTGNGDNTKWTATITYNSDADYTFDIAFTDLAGNVAGPADYGNSAAPTAFTIDKTLPTVNVTYDNNDVANDMYYKSARTATVTIVEHNFNAAKVTISLQATDDGSAIESPAVNGWTTYGDTHTATISYSNDGKYVFDIAVKDNAGNNSAEFAEQTFVVDTKAPTLTITGVVDKSANNGVVAPVITYSDTNYSADLVTINFSGANRGVLKLDGTSTDIHNGKTFVFNNFANEKSMDDIYTLEVTLTDLAGNTSTQKVQFSVNRFGSTYAMSAETQAIDGRYIQAPIDVVFTEVNPNALVEFKVTVFKNNSPVVLTKGVDYDVEEVGSEGTWREYKYIIHADNFADDGVYSVTIFSEDEAGNISENTLDTKNVDSKSSLQFGVDKTLPNVVASNLNSNTTYAVELYTVKLLVSDNLKLHSIDVYLDNSAEPYRTWDAAEIAAIVSGEYVFNIDDSSTSAHTVRIVATDEAGNVQELTVSNFYVTTNLFVRYYTNTPLFVGSIIGFILLIAIIVFIVVMSRRKRYNRR